MLHRTPAVPFHRALGAGLACLAVLVMGAWVPGTGWARTSADVVVRDLQTPSDVVTAGRPLTLTVNIRNTGTRDAKATETWFLLSKDTRRSSRDRRLDGALRVGRLAAGASLDREVEVLVGARVPRGDYRILACTDALDEVQESNERNNCRASDRTLQVVEPSSGDLIDEALTDGRISEVQALTYAIYAAFEDPRLPQQYVGGPLRDEQVGEAFDKLTGAWASLPPEVQADLDPFLRPPIYEGSASADPATSGAPAHGVAARDATAGCFWGTGGTSQPADVIEQDDWTSTSTEHFTIWHQTTDQLFHTAAQSAATAGFVADVIEDIWSAETALLGREPLSDADQRCNGGDGRLDIYVSRRRLNTGAYVQAYPPGCQQRPSFLSIAPDHATTEKLTRDILAHEFSHMVQYAYPHQSPCQEYGWLEEATANWMVDHVYPADNYEHKFAPSYMDGGFRYPLETYFATGASWPDPRAAEYNGYEDYVFLQFLARTFGPSVIAEIWEGTTGADSLKAIDDAIPGGFDEVWHDFAMAAWNRAPVDAFQQWDGLDSRMPSEGPRVPTLEIELGDAQRKEYKLRGRRLVEHLAINHTVIDVPDTGVRALKLSGIGFRGVGVSGDDLDGDTSGKVQAWLRLADGTSRVEDWTGRKSVTLCRERPSENVVQLVLLHSNSAFTPRDHRLNFPQDGAKVVASKGRCLFPRTFSGTAEGTYAYGNFVETWEATYKLKRISTGPYASYTVAEETVEWSLTGTGTCNDDSTATYSASDTFTYTDGVWPVLHINGPTVDPPWQPNTYKLELNPGPFYVYKGVTKACAQRTEMVSWTPLNCGESGTTGATPIPWRESGLSGTRTYLTGLEACDAVDDISVTWSWDLEGAS